MITRPTLRRTLALLVASTIAPAAFSSLELLAASRPRCAVSSSSTSRRYLPKTPLSDSRRRSSRLAVKFDDELEVRCTARSGLFSRVGAQISAVASILDRFEARLEPLLDLPEEELQAFRERAASLSCEAQP